MKYTLYIMVASALMLSSCSLYKNYQSEATVQTDLYGDQQVGDSASLASLPWNEFYTDAHLRQLIQHGLDNNNNVAVAELNITKAKESLRAARMAYLPSVSLSPSVEFSSAGKTTSNSYAVALSGQWQIPTLGTIPSRSKQAQVATEQAADQTQAVKTALVGNIAAEYYNLLMLDRELAIYKETIGLWKEALETMKAMFESGMCFSPAISQLAANIEELEINVIDIEHSIYTTESGLCMLMGDATHTIERGTFDEFKMPDVIETGVPALLLKNRPDVRAAERAMAVAYYATQQSRAAFYPGINLTASLGWGFNPAKFLSDVLGSVVAPVFQAGKLNANLKISEAEQEQSRFMFAETLLKAGNEVVDAMYSCKSADKKSAHIKRQIELNGEAVASTKELMNNGKVNYLEVLQAQQSLLQSQMLEVQNRTNGITSMISLYTALGGGF